MARQVNGKWLFQCPKPGSPSLSELSLYEPEAEHQTIGDGSRSTEIGYFEITTHHQRRMI